MKKLLLLVALLAPTMVFAGEPIRFGDNRSQWAHDGECDDRRFFGPGVDEDLMAEDIGHDAADCRRLYKEGRIRFWVESKARAATECSKIRFGDNASQWSKDGECDDPRFEGRGMSKDLDSDDTGHDARDCRQMCKTGMIYLRNY